MINGKSYTLTLDECVDALLKKKISPKRAIAPSLIVFGVGLAMLITPVFWHQVKFAQSPFVDKGWVDFRPWYIAYIISGTSCILGASFWRREGNTSLERAKRGLRAYFREHLAPKEVTFDEESWTVRHQSGSEEKRKFSHIKFSWEKPETLSVITDIVHVFPKRIFSADELAELRRLCHVEMQSSERQRESALSVLGGILEYAFWHRRLITAIVIIAPLFLAPWAFMETYENPRMGLTEYSFVWWKIFAAIAIWYFIFLLYNLFIAVRFATKVRYEALDENEFSFLYGEKAVSAQWTAFADAHEGLSCFLFEKTIGSYQLFCKRSFTPSEQALLRSKVVLIRDGVDVSEKAHA